MGVLDLRRAMRPGAATTFDYAAVSAVDLTRELQAAAENIRAMQRAAIVDIGLALIAVKEKLDHGQFLVWIEAEFGWGRRTAVNMMQVAAEFGDKWEKISHLPTTVLYKLAAPSTPPAVREAVLDLKPGEVVTPRGVQAAIEAAKKAEAPKKSSLKQAEREAQRAKEEEQRRARIARADREREKEMRARDAAAVRVKALLSDKLPELSDVLREVDSFALSQILREMVQAYRARIAMGGQS